ncbi:arylsulfatase [Novosphingobium sp. 11B]
MFGNGSLRKALARSSAILTVSCGIVAAACAQTNVPVAPASNIQTSTPDGRSREVLPIVDSPFRGVTGTTVAESRPDWPVPVAAPAGAPNVLLIMTDDVGFAATSAFGGAIPTPNLDRLAKRGVRYNNFHTTGMCSPTRAALLTGRNSHAVGSGAVTDVASGYPGYSSIIPRSAASIGEVLRDNGYNTAFFGKHHNIPSWESSLSGPFDHWPTGLGFDYFYGFVIGDTNQWNPRLYRNTLSVDAPALPQGQTLDFSLADDAIHWIHQQKATGPDRPFFAYFAPGSAHAPHQAPPEWIARFKGRFDRGWDSLREENFQRQKREGVIPANATLTPRPAEIPAWSSLTPVQKRVYARYMEVFAAMIAYQDAQVGRILDELDRMGQSDNTMVLYLVGDNGPSGEGAPTGTLNQVQHMSHDFEQSAEEVAGVIDTMGGPDTIELYPAGWGWAMGTPFRYMKQLSSHLGAIRNGMVVSWPGHLNDTGTVRTQFAHVTDIFPTILEAVRLPVPRQVNGIDQQPVDGVSLDYTFTHPRAPEQHKVQYFEMFGNRAIYADGWMANTTPRRMPWEMGNPGGNPYTDYKWELYDLARDFSQSRDLATANPAKLAQMQALWLEEARRNHVLPLDDNLAKSRLGASHAHYASGRTSFAYWGGNLSISENQAPSFRSRAFTISADVTLDVERATAPILARGSRFGGWAFYLRDGVPVVRQAYTQRPQDQAEIVGKIALGRGASNIGFAFTPDGAGKAGGTMCMTVNGAEAGCGHLDYADVKDAGQGETMDIGIDTGAPVSTDYAANGPFPGAIHKVQVELTGKSEAEKDKKL